MKSEMELASLTEPVFDGPNHAKETTPTVALVCMTNKGARTLSRLFTSVENFVDLAVILYTGKEDADVEWMEGYPHMKCIVHKADFVNFEESRNRLNQIAKGTADWLLLLDDDMALTFTTHSPKSLKRALRLDVPQPSCYLLKHAGQLSYWNSRLARGDREWKYKGVTHEYLEVVFKETENLHGVEVEHYFTHPPEKFERDLRLLAADIARDPDDSRTIFYLANTLRDMGRIVPAIRFYCMRANMGGWDEEVYVSKVEAAKLAKDPKAMEVAYNFRKHRAEAPAWLVKHYRQNGESGLAAQWERIRSSIAVPHDILFIDLNCYGPVF